MPQKIQQPSTENLIPASPNQSLGKYSKYLQENEFGLQKYEFKDGILKKERAKAHDYHSSKENLTKMN